MTTPAIVVMGASWGGMTAIARVLQGLDPHFSLAVAVAQHRSPDLPDVMVRYLQRHSPLPVREVDDKDSVQGGHIFVAPPDYHVLVEPGHFALSTEGPVRFSRPSVDVLFESAADAYGASVVAVVLTGANDDGCRGVVAVKSAGGLVIVQEPATAERSEMPEAAIASGAVDLVLPLEGIPAELNRLAVAA